MYDLIKKSRISRQNTLAMIYHARSGHPGGSLSCIDLLVALYHFGEVNNVVASELTLILSKGHAVPAWYAVATEFNLLDKKLLPSFRKINSVLQGHPHIGATPWVMASTGSLGQGFSVAMGMALGFRHQKLNDSVYVILGDGELQEGEVWEAAMSSGHFGLENLCVIVDYNKMQSDDANGNIMGLEPLADKWLSFNWNVIEIDGHDFDQINSALVSAKNTSGKPTVIIAHTIKGKGVSYMENVPAWHGSVTLRREELELALQDLNATEFEISDYIDGEIWGKK
jgi:transketolase